MLCTAHSLILRDSDIIPARLLHPVALTVIIANADLEHNGVIYLDAEKLTDLASTYFATSAGADLSFMLENCKHSQIDWVRISTSTTYLPPTN